MSVYLPPGYENDSDRRYPVVYVLHGFTDSDIYWFGWREHFVNVPAAMERALDEGTTRGMILVMPNAYTAFQGSMYSSSVTTGDWETFVAEDLVGWVDAHYRTLPDRGSRGLAGHSMGGYGAIRMAMKRPEVFSSVYVMSPCCLAPDLDPEVEGRAALEDIRSFEDLRGASFGARAALASAAAWSPNPERPPFYLDLPVEGGEVRPEVVARQTANAIHALVPQYAANLRRLGALAVDTGDRDGSITGATRRLGELLELYWVPHTLEVYPGDHVSGVHRRIEENVLPFFSRRLDFEGASPRSGG